jgi:hypothetical protein
MEMLASFGQAFLPETVEHEIVIGVEVERRRFVFVSKDLGALGAGDAFVFSVGEPLADPTLGFFVLRAETEMAPGSMDAIGVTRFAVHGELLGLTSPTEESVRTRGKEVLVVGVLYRRAPMLPFRTGEGWHATGRAAG